MDRRRQKQTRYKDWEKYGTPHLGKWLPDLPAAISDGISLPMVRLLHTQSLTAALRAFAAYISGGTAETGRDWRRNAEGVSWCPKVC